MPAAIAARENGAATVIIVEGNSNFGGHAIVNVGNVVLGGGTNWQKKFGVVDSKELLYNDLIDWTVTETNGQPDYRYNDREIIRAYADWSADTANWLQTHGMPFDETAGIDSSGGHMCGNSAPREHHCFPGKYIMPATGNPSTIKFGTTGISEMNHGAGVGYIMPLYEDLQKTGGATILLSTRMTAIIREQRTSGRVIGITAETGGKTINIRARKGVIVATGGSTSNVHFRMMFDPRLTEEYQCAGMPYSPQDASGELAAMAVNASLWGLANQSYEIGQNLCTTSQMGCKYGYPNLSFQPKSLWFKEAGATGIIMGNKQNCIMVRGDGLRFFDETAGQYPFNNFDTQKPYVQLSWRNALNQNVKYNPSASNFINAAMSPLKGDLSGKNGGGPVWCIFDADAVKRENLDVTPPMVDTARGYFFSANSLAELANKMVMEFQKKPIPAQALQDTVARYNSFVDKGVDEDFDKPKPQFKIQTAPFYAAWTTPLTHDTRTGLQINYNCEVIDNDGKVIPGLYAGGESAGGFTQHGLARCAVQGRLAGMNAAKQNVGGAAAPAPKAPAAKAPPKKS
jgi:succinate dehydrogenase/fumarate reductase flavoprotein subunit